MRIRPKDGAIWLLALAVLLPAASVLAQTSALPAPQTVASGADGITITSHDVLSELQKAPANVRQLTAQKPEFWQQLANNLLVRRLLAHEAVRDHLDQDPLVAAALNIARDRVLSDARLARMDAQNEPSPVALDAYARNAYKANTSRFEQPEQVRASHILLPNTGPESLQKAKDLLAQLRAGGSFEALAKANSTDAGSAARGGDLGFFGASKMVRPFEEAVNALGKPGDLSEPVETQFGYHIIRLDERKPKAVQPYDEVKDQLLAEARNAILSTARVSKVADFNKNIHFDSAAIEALSKSAGH